MNLCGNAPMIQMRIVALGISVLMIGVAPAPAEAQAQAPETLHMRPTHALPVPRRSAQAAPDPPPPTDEPAGSGAAAAPPPDAAAPAEAQPAAPTEGQPPAPAAAAAAAPAASSDAEFEKLAEQDLQEEVIVITGSAIERKALVARAPLTVLDRSMLEASGRSTVGDMLQTLPGNVNGVNAQNNNTATG